MRAHRPLASLLVCLGILSSGTAMSETIQVSVDGKSYPIEMADNADARTFLARLPMTLTFENFGRNERICISQACSGTRTRRPSLFDHARNDDRLQALGQYCDIPRGLPVEFRLG